MSSDGIVGDIRSICGMLNDAVGTLSGLFKSGASLVCFVGARCPRQAAKYPSAVIKLVSPSNNTNRCVFLTSPRYRTLA